LCTRCYEPYQLSYFEKPVTHECPKGRGTHIREAASLIERAKKYLKSSRTLLVDGDYESSVSRAYYAMFYSAEAVLLTKNLSFSSHRGVISAFREYFVKTHVLQYPPSNSLFSSINNFP